MKQFLLTLVLLLFGIFTLQAAEIPAFPGGEEALQKYIADNIKYPARALQNGIEGDVAMQFVVKADGSISSVKVTRMIDPDLEEEAIRLVREMPARVPADKNGQPTDAVANIVVSFRLPEE